MIAFLSKSKVFIFAILLLFFTFDRAAAFRPVGHILLQRTIAQRLPQGHIFRVAMDSFPVFAAWGAVGPDIGYVPRLKGGPGFKRKLAQSFNLADIAHYYKSGIFTRALIQRAVASKDQQLIAFAAGWLTHVGGDFGAHDLFVYPEAGYYLDNPKGKPMHEDLERAAETYLFLAKGKYLSDSAFYLENNLEGGTIFEHFFGLPYGWGNGSERRKKVEEDYGKIASFLEAVYEEQYGEELVADVPSLMQAYDLAFGKGPKSFGFEIIGRKEADSLLQQHGRAERLLHAFDSSVALTATLLRDCLTNEFAGFKDSWNLDAGPDASTLVIRTVVGSERYNGSKKPLFVNLYLKTLHEHPIHFRVPMLGNVRYNLGDVLYSYLYLDPCAFEPSKDYRFTVSMGKGIKDRVVLEQVQLFYNGRLVGEIKEPVVLNRKHPVSRVFALKTLEP